MDIVRNFIHIVGITPGEELPGKIQGQAIEYAETETICIPMDMPPARSIFQVVMQVESTSNRRIYTPQGEITVIDGVRKYKIIYAAGEDSEKAVFLDLHLPFNTFFEIPNGEDTAQKVDIYILDAYFELLDDRRIYSHILYYIYVPYEHPGLKTDDTKNARNMDLSYLPLEKKEKAMEYPMLQEAMDEVLVSKEPDDPGKPMGKHDREAGGREKERAAIDIDAEYL